VWMGGMALLFVLVPHWLLDVLRPENMGAEWFSTVQEKGTVLLRFVACYCLLSSMALIYFGAVRGAGDTHYVMWVIVITAILLLSVPLFIAQEMFGAGLNVLWGIFTFYVLAHSAIAYHRFHTGPWKSMRVIETPVPETPLSSADDTVTAADKRICAPLVRSEDID